MKIAFRTDASLKIGTGHVMRCLTLADALQEAGAQCHFICREHPGNLIELIRQRGFLVSVLPLTVQSVVTPEQRVETQPIYAAWLGADWNTDAEQSKVGVGETAVDWLIVDHYALDARWEQMLRPLCRHLMVIDDLANRAHDCDLLLDQNLGRDERDYCQFVPKSCTVLVSPKYALLRPEFAALREASLRRRAIPQFKHLLITMGGVDQADATSKVLEALRECTLPADLNITVVMGQHAPWLEQVKYRSGKMPVLTEVKCNVENMAQVMAYSDLAIGAAGSTSWERCCLGLPSMIGVLADNQIFIADALQAAGAAKTFVLNEEMTTLRAAIAEFADNPGEIARMSTCAANVTDGFGANRIPATLVNISLAVQA
jgi:UDP-2,4-diacetamido-2,4,6-trideoxy-beta-L-altropyranose hydrolase